MVFDKTAIVLKNIAIQRMKRQIEQSAIKSIFMDLNFEHEANKICQAKRGSMGDDHRQRSFYATADGERLRGRRHAER